MKFVLKVIAMLATTMLFAISASLLLCDVFQIVHKEQTIPIIPVIAATIISGILLLASVKKVEEHQY